MGTTSKRQRNRIGFTDREFEVARLVAAGLKNLDIAHALFIEEDTVKTHVARTLDKAGVKTRSSLALKMLFDGDLSIPELRDLIDIGRRYGSLY